jgi:hypothetical protein
MEPKDKNIINIGRNDRDAIARETGMTEFTPKQRTERKAIKRTPELSRNARRTITALGAATAVLGTAWLAGPRSHDAPQPDDKKNFTEQVIESAHTPYDPATDELVIDGIRVKPGGTPSEAVLGDPRVKAFVENHPDESSSVTTSAMSLPGGDEAGIVMRDVDHDGDKDAVAVEVKEHPLIQIEDKTIH